MRDMQDGISGVSHPELLLPGPARMYHSFIPLSNRHFWSTCCGPGTVVTGGMGVGREILILESLDPHRGILLSYRKEGSTDTCHNVDEP